MKFFLAYLAAMTTFLILDGLWLGFIAKDKYSQWIGHLMTDNVLWFVALGFYILYVFGVLYFSVVSSTTLSSAVLNGALLGGLCYATYDLTNWATLKDWPVQMVLVDIIWGMVITGTCAAVGYWVYNR